MPIDSIINTAIFLAMAAQQIVEAFVRPLKVKFPTWDLWWVIYATWILGGVFAWGAGVNLFSQLFVNPEWGRVLSAVVIGGGSQLVKTLFKVGEAVVVLAKSVTPLIETVRGKQ